jgi:hypothetical protein
MWRLTKAIIVSWLVGVVCGAAMVIVSQHDDRAPPAVSASRQITPPSNETPVKSPDAAAR